MNKERIVTLTKVMVAIALLWELYGPEISHSLILYFTFPCALYFAYDAFKNNRYVLGNVYLLMSCVYNPIFSLPLSSGNLILANTISVMALLGHICSWYFLSYRFTVLYNQSEYDKAEKIAVKAFEVARETVGMNHSMTLSSLDDLIDAYKATLKYKEAMMLIEYVISAYSLTKGFSEPKLSSFKSDLMELKQLVPSTSEVKLLSSSKPVQTAVKQQPAFAEARGHNSLIKIARSLVGTAFAYSIQHKFDEAEKLMKYAVSICEEAEGAPELELYQARKFVNKEHEQDMLIADLFESNSHEPFYWPPKKMFVKHKVLKRSFALG